MLEELYICNYSLCSQRLWTKCQNTSYVFVVTVTQCFPLKQYCENTSETLEMVVSECSTNAVAADLYVSNKELQYVIVTFHR